MLLSSQPDAGKYAATCKEQMKNISRKLRARSEEEEGQVAADHRRVPVLSDSQTRIRHFPNATKKEKIPVDNGTYIEQSENITSKGEPND
ncbi:hypothetical protein GGE16_001460 [Rhizobium leguminosarum]|uniref:Uncharacterized protein n=1 Tax=Rhizobium leguminosarum TaxID=384 RepID=A0AAE2MHU2_RHILE|nr:MULTISPECIES: hypothetical protein [Rhizobium]MBB4289444.1 hypothetical protein [Rhizobium leguminosarum]MBB4294461.1 hypothetical protein [Rhizobium leguminosarum]MBB4305856.1 hypothetical protein [Rhizobium leguminosarum]MBB4418566.1 hypothetical protein [Rhizobium leguminosarum]MBB4433411.1 hypothetical protein [Rhizobium esperanzae]